MYDLEDAIRLIEQQTAVRRARCVIADEGIASESTLLGTRDGYLNLARMLLTFVADVDAGRLLAEGGVIYDDRVRSVLYQLPTQAAWIWGCQLFKTHAEYMTKLREFTDPQISDPLTNDPQFHDPAEG